MCVCVAAAVATVAVLSVLQLVCLGVCVSLCAWILKQQCVLWGDVHVVCVCVVAGFFFSCVHEQICAFHLAFCNS